MSEPKRIQRKRTKGWRMPTGAVYVGRPTKFGNPWRPTPFHTAQMALEKYRFWVAGGRVDEWGTLFVAPIPQEIAQLRGKDLACWCALGQPCHADVLLELANGRATTPEGRD